MSRVRQFFSSLNFPGIGKNANLTIDFGNFRTKVIVDDQLIFNQASCYVADKLNQVVLSYGDQARSLLGKEPAQARVVFPFKNGVIYDRQNFKQFFEIILKEIKSEQNWSWLSKLKVVVTVPHVATTLDRKIFKNSLFKLGLNKIEILEKSSVLPLALPNKHNAQFIVDVGDRLTELVIATGGQSHCSRTVCWGGADLTRIIQEYLRDEFDIAVSLRQALKLKHQLVNVTPASAPKKKAKTQDNQIETKTNVRGLDLVSHLIVTKTISLDRVNQALIKELGQLFHQLQRFFSQVPAEQLMTAFDHGLFLTGGGGLITGLDEYLSNWLSIEVLRLPEPQLSVVKGAAAFKKKS